MEKLELGLVFELRCCDNARITLKTGNFSHSQQIEELRPKSRCHTGIDDEQHLLTACPAVNRQNIQDIQLEDIYTLPINRDKLKRLAKFVTQYEDSK